METSSYEEAADITTGTTRPKPHAANFREPAYSLPLCKIDVEVNGKVVKVGVIDPSSQIVVI